VFATNQKKIFKLLSLTFFLLFSKQAFAYPNFIGFAYTSCLTCHYNPMGNGPLTDYGRALGAGVVADRYFYSKDTKEETISENSGFFYSKPKQKWFRASFDYRGLYMKQNFYSDASSKAEIIHMDANLNFVTKFGKKDNVYTSVTIGYAPLPRSAGPNPTGADANSFRSREHYIAWRPTPAWGIYAGMLDKTFGIRIVDHTAYSRSITGLAMNDQTHGVLVHYTNKKFEIGVHPFIGNLVQESGVRQVGFSTQFEYTLNQKNRIGASFLNSKSTYLQMNLMAAHSRMAFGKGHSLMVEAGMVSKTELIPGDKVTSQYIMMQNHVRASRGLFALVTAEYLKPNTETENKTLRIGPGFQYFPVQGIEVRADIYNARIFSATSVSEDQWDITGQLHLWF
jgi:hypothetical protein